MNLTRSETARAEPHMAALVRYVATLNAQGRGHVPHFDPHDGGVRARLLLLLEKPGPGSQPPAGSGFVSRDNATQTARTIRDGMAAAGVPRDACIIWNAVPWWNGTMKVRAAERRAGLAELPALLQMLPNLRCVVLAGNAARDAEPVVREHTDLRVFTCVHPSPQARAGPASSAAWLHLPRIWQAAWQAVWEDPTHRQMQTG